MGQITITLPPELEKEIEEYLGFERDEEDLSELVREALTAYLEAQRSQLEIINPERPHRFLQFPPGAFTGWGGRRVASGCTSSRAAVPLRFRSHQISPTRSD
jgi:Arc/MetJ-type ribon-helix-helix transcriptional regulator